MAHAKFINCMITLKRWFSHNELRFQLSHFVVTTKYFCSCKVLTSKLRAWARTHHFIMINWWYCCCCYMKNAHLKNEARMKELDEYASGKQCERIKKENVEKHFEWMGWEREKYLITEIEVPEKCKLNNAMHAHKSKRGVAI